MHKELVSMIVTAGREKLKDYDAPIKGIKFPPLEPDIFRQRLLIKEGVGAPKGSLTKCVQHYREFADLVVFIMQNQSPFDITNLGKLETIKDEISMELRLHELEMKQLKIRAVTAESDIMYYDSQASRLQLQIESTKLAIKKLREKLDLEILIRKNREELEEISRRVISYPSISKSCLEIGNINANIDSINKRDKGVRIEIDMRKKQFHLLMQSLLDIKLSFNS